MAYVDLIAIVNFMYHGEVMVSEEQLPSFLQTATILQVSGLINNETPYSLNRQSAPTKKIKPSPNEHQECPTKKIKANPKGHKSTLAESICKMLVPPVPLGQLETDKIKVESQEDMEENSDQNLNKIYEAPEKMESQSHSSILEAALEVKSGSILERSLTSQPTCGKPTAIPVPSETLKTLPALPDISIPKTVFIPRKPPESEMERLILRSSSESSSSPSSFERPSEYLQQSIKVEGVEQPEMEVSLKLNSLLNPFFWKI